LTVLSPQEPVGDLPLEGDVVLRPYLVDPGTGLPVPVTVVQREDWPAVSVIVVARAR
jgi:hypothetical protein